MKSPKKKIPGFLRMGPLVVYANLAVFIAYANWLVSSRTNISHHWVFPVHEALLLAQCLVLPAGAAGRSLTVLSFLVLGIGCARLETIYLSHHLVHYAMAFALGALMHGRLGIQPKAPWHRVNQVAAAVCAAVSIAAFVIALRYGIWWGIK